MGGSSSPTVGYRYFLGMHMGICRGPVDSLVEIRVGDKKAWPLAITTPDEGTDQYVGIGLDEHGEGIFVWVPATYSYIEESPPVTESSSIMIRAPGLFGGDEKEGGIEGQLDVMMGEDTQLVNPRLAAMLGNSLVSAFRGMFTLFYDGLVCSMNPYPKAWKFRVRRALKGWDGDVFYPATAVMDIVVMQPKVAGGPIVANHIAAMNPAHIIWECCTNRDWGRGLTPDLLDEAAFTAAADTLYNEGFGLCLAWTREDTVDAFIQRVIDHIGAVLYVSRSTGRLVLELLRNDYVVGDLPLLTTTTGILTIEDDDASASQTLINELVVKMMDPLSGGERQVRVQNIGSMQASEAILSKSVDYPGIPTVALATRVAQRDLRICGTPLRRFKMTMDRRAYALVPGGLFRFTDTLRGITNMVMRIGRLEDTPDSQLLITAIQDIFGLPAVSYVSGATNSAGGLEPAAPEDAIGAISEQSYIGILRWKTTTELGALTGDEAYVMLMGARPSLQSQNYDVYTGNNTIGFKKRNTGIWTPAAVLTADITELGTTLYISNVTLPNPVLPVAGIPAIIGDEWVRLDAWNAETSTFTIARGVGDTIPEHHSSGDMLWLISKGVGIDPTIYVETDVIEGRLLTNTAGGQLAVPDATPHSITLVGRWIRPYPPGLVKVNDRVFPEAAPPTADFTVTWAMRNRLTQADRMIPYTSTTITPESGQTATILVREGLGGSGTVVRTVTGITSDTWSYSTANWIADGSPVPLTIELFSDRDGFDSWKHYLIPITFTTPLSASISSVSTATAYF